MKRLIAILLLLFPALIYAATSIIFSTEIHDFGVVRQGEVLEYAFEFTNTGTTDLSVERLTAS